MKSTDTSAGLFRIFLLVIWSLLVKFLDIFVEEGHLASHDEVNSHSQTIHIGWEAIALELNGLRSQERSKPTHFS